MTFIITFIGLSIINVIFSTVRSITTIKSGKTVASLVSGGYFAFYNIMLIYTVANFPMWQKCVITFVCNVMGVWLVKFVEEKMRKDRLWKIEFTTRMVFKNEVEEELENAGIPHYFMELGKHICFVCFAENQQQSTKVKEIISNCNGKYFVSETKILQKRG